MNILIFQDMIQANSSSDEDFIVNTESEDSDESEKLMRVRKAMKYEDGWKSKKTNLTMILVMKSVKSWVKNIT
jgi:hypothetical protein